MADSIWQKYIEKHSAGLYPVASIKLANKEWDEKDPLLSV